MAPRSSAALIGLALAAPLAVCATLSAARGTVESDNAVLVLVLVVVAVAASGSRLAGVVAALSSAAWFDYFLTRPFHHFTIADRDDVETAVLLTLVGVAVTEIALWGRRQQARLSEREGYLTGVIAAADLVARGEAPPKVVLDFVGQQIAELLTLDSCTYAVGPPGAHARLERDGSITRDGSRHRRRPIRTAGQRHRRAARARAAAVTVGAVRPDRRLPCRLDARRSSGGSRSPSPTKRPPPWEHLEARLRDLPSR